MAPMKRRVLAFVSGVLLVSGASQAQAATTIGQSPPSVGSPSPASGCNTGGALYDFVQTSNVSGASYTVPGGGGVITSWKTSTSVGTASVKLRVFTVSGTSFTPVGESALETLTSSSSTPYLTRIPVVGGEQLGFAYSTSNADACVNVGATPGDAYLAAPSGSLNQPEMSTTGSSQILFNVSAAVEADADHDGYGDETQDLCPTDPATHGNCPVVMPVSPETTITEKPAAKTKDKQATFGFSSDQPGATFECNIDGTGYKLCTSPRLFTVGVGKHLFQVRATSSGQTDPTPASYEWTVIKKKHKKHHHHGGHG